MAKRQARKAGAEVKPKAVKKTANRKPGRPKRGEPVKTPDRVEVVARLWASGQTYSEIAQQVGASKSSVARWIKDDIRPQWCERIEGRIEDEVAALNLLIVASMEIAANGETKVIRDANGDVLRTETTRSTRSLMDTARLLEQRRRLNGTEPTKATLTGHLPHHEVMPVQTPPSSQEDEPLSDHDDWNPRESKCRSAGASRERVMEEGVARLRRVVARIRAIKAVAEAA